MWLKHCLLLCAVLSAQAVKLKMKGAISVGSEVAEILSHYFNDGNLFSSGRRTMSSTFDDLQKQVKELQLCKDLTFCDIKMQAFIVEYALALIDVVRKTFDGVLDDEFCKVKYVQKTLRQVKKVVKNANLDNDEVNRWTNVLKKISANFIEKSLQLADEASNKAEKKKEQAMIMIRQQLTFSIANVERIYLLKLCKDHTLCPFQYNASTYLQHLLNLIKTMNETKVKIFVKEFKTSFLRAPMFKELDERTVKRFAQILNDMMLDETVSAKNIILSITDVVQTRLALIEPAGKDALLLQSILSDLDHLYVSSVDEPIETFLDSFKKWLRDDNEPLSVSMEAFYNGLATHLSNQSSELVFKLKIEAMVFLEVTVGPSHTVR